jgi:phospholipase C
MAQDPKPANTNGLENIKHVVVLMFENRSFDHLFGDFPNVNGLFDGNGNFKDDCYNLPNPLEPPSSGNKQCFPSPVDPSAPLKHDFTHDFGDGMMPDLFGPIFKITGDAPPHPSNSGAIYNSGYTVKGLVGQIEPLPTTYPATNPGFYTTYNTCAQQQQSVMSYFTNGTLQVLHALAQEFVLCDNWHCDMPGHTLPNRAFIHCGTTCGKDGTTGGIDDMDGGMVNSTSIFDVINQQSGIKQPPTWAMYAPDNAYGQPFHLDTKFLNPALQSTPGTPLSQFATDCTNETLPFYSFIMCWTANTDIYTDTSMHPNSMMQGGENMLAAVYNALRNSNSWKDTLLVVTFDENGGIYDHVFPPTTTPPDPKAGATPQHTTGCCGNDWILNSSFDFSLLGLRVPALFISPWLANGIDSTQYQNTSVLRFLIDMMNANYGTNASCLTSRDGSAPPLDSVFSQFGQSTMRTDCPDWMAPYPTLPCNDPATGSNEVPYSDGTLTQWIPPPDILSAPPVPYINELLNIYAGPLPGHPDSDQKITRDFATIGEVNEYVEERQQAAEAYWGGKKTGS